MIKNISVLGAGTMGQGIAIVFAIHGYQVSLYESVETVREQVREKAKSQLGFMVSEQYISNGAAEQALEQITLYGDLDKAVQTADYVIEAVPEQMELKQKLFEELDRLAPKHAVFASNTSSLPLTGMLQLLSEERKKRTLVCHWYNPACFVPIVELSFFGNMSEELFEEVYCLYEGVGKRPVKVLKDIPGLLANRMLHALARETFSLIEQGAASAEDVDRALKFGPGFRSATTGMLEMADMGGLDVWCTVEDNLFKELNNAEQAFDMMRAKVECGKLGLKSGEGFFSYPEESRAQVKESFDRRMICQLKVLQNIDK